jgi:hypothetical protein
MMVRNPLIVAARDLRVIPQQASARLEPTHVNNAKEATALHVSSWRFEVRAARKYGVINPAAKPTAIAIRNIKTADTRRIHARVCVRMESPDTRISVRWSLRASDYPQDRAPGVAAKEKGVNRED